MTGEYTNKFETYKNIALHNGIKFDNKEDEQALDNTIMDFINLEEQKKEKELENKRKQKEYLDKNNKFKNCVKSNLGSFYFSYYNIIIDKLSPQNLTRFIYLCCFMNYKNQLVHNKHGRQIPIYENELEEVLKLKKTETYKTKTQLIEQGLLIVNPNDKSLMINDCYCIKGEPIKNPKKVERARLFEDGIKDIYLKSLPKEHKNLAILFRLLPYVNLRWNIVCKDVTEEIKENIVPYELKEVCNIIGEKNITRFKNKLMNITVFDEPVICLGTIKNKTSISINPKIYYKGSVGCTNELTFLLVLFDSRKNMK